MRNDTDPSGRPVSSRSNDSGTQPIIVPDTIPERPGDTDAWFSDSFFEEEGIVDAELPAESELNISGRKYISADFTSTEFPDNPQRESRSNVSVDQQLQVKVRGSVADDLLEVQIDYDDSLPQVERQQTRILYTGRERNAGIATFQAKGKFGDVHLSLPGSTFVSYNKSVFGLSGQAHLTDFHLGSWGPERLSIYGVASEKKGETQKEVFTGSNQRRVPDPVADISPIRRTYYQPLADRLPSNRRLPIQVNSEQILVDDQNESNNDANTIEGLTVENGSDTYQGDFDVLSEGDDYSINYRTGVIRFKTNIQNNFVLAVSMTLSDGSQLDDFMIKDPEETEKFDRYHLLNRYSLASRNIVRNDPNRVLEIRDPTDSTQPDGDRSYAQILEMDNNNDGVIDNEFIDFEIGVLRFPDTRPFVSDKLSNNGADTNPTVYGPPSQRQKVYEIYQEILVEENSYSLGVNVVRGSEDVSVDGRSLERGKDYTIDYQSGFLTFFDHVDINEESQIEVTYEQQGVTQRDETFLGGRLEAVFSDNLSFGSTLLSGEEAEQGDVPLVGNTSKSTTVSEFDASWKPLRSLQDVIGLFDEGWRQYPWDDNLKMDLRYEWAESSRNPAQEGLALVDNFSQLDRRIRFSKSQYDWSPGDPVQQFPGPADTLNNRSGFSFDRVENTGHDPDPPEDESQRSLRVKFDMGPESGGKPDTWGSIQHLFSSNGRDLRGYQYLEFWVRWENDAAGGTLAVDLGQVTENTNRDGLLTEDENNNESLNPGEDDGYVTHDFRFGQNNGQLDSEDLDQNGRLDEVEGYLHFPSVNRADTVITDTTSHGWTHYKIPLKGTYGEARGNANRFGRGVSDTQTRDEVLKNSGMVRLVYQSPDDSGEDRSFLLEQMGVVQTRWEPRNDTPAFNIDVKTSVEDPRLPAPGTNKLRDQDVNETNKAMSFSFRNIDREDSPVSQAFIDFPGGQDVRQFENLKLFFNTRNYQSTGMSGNGDTGFIRFGTDGSNYFQYSFPLLDPASSSQVEGLGNDWYELTVDVDQLEEDLIQKTLFDTSPKRFETGNRIIVGSPSLLKVKQYVIGFIGPQPPLTAEGELLFDGLHLSGVRKEVGTAEQLKAEVDIQEGLVKFEATDRQIDGEFRTIGLVNNSIANDFVPQNESARTVTGSVDVDRYLPKSWPVKIPFNFDWSDRTTRIPPDRIERVRNDNLGTVSTVDQTFNSGLNTPSRYPSISFNWRETDKRVDQERRQKEWSEDLDRWRLNGNYDLSFRDSIGGVFPIGEKIKFTFNGNYGRLTDRRRSFGEVDVDTETRKDVSRGVTSIVDHEPWDWIESRTRVSFSDLTRTTLETDGLVNRDQSLDWTFDFSSFWGLQPRFNVSTGTHENFDRGNGVSKSVDLDGNTELRINTKPELWWQALDFLTLNYSYSVNSSARYTNLDSSRSVGDVYRNYYEGLSWLVSGPDIQVTSDTLTLSRTRANKNVSHRLGGQLRTWEFLESRYNLNYSQNFGQSNNSINRTNVLSLSLSNRLRLRDVSPLFANHTQNSSLGLDYNFSRSYSSRKVSQTHSPSFQWNTRWDRRWSTNLNFTANITREREEAVQVRERRYAPSLNFKWLVNQSGTSRGTLWFDNRLELNGNLTFETRKRVRNGEVRTDEWETALNVGSAYNITRRIKSRFGGSYSIFRDQFRQANDRNTYGFNVSLDFRF